MNYLNFLLVFVIPPMLGLMALLVLLRARGSRPQPRIAALHGGAVVALHVLIAFVWTTPWDNYLVYSNVWGYPDGGVIAVIGYVPVEEYAFFVLQTLLTGSWLLLIRRYAPLLPRRPFTPRPALRIAGVSAAATAWTIFALLFAQSLLTEDTSGRYLTLIMIWALIPLALQFGYGADVLWYHRRLILTAIAVPSLYLSIADAYAIADGTWAIHTYTSSGANVWFPIYHHGRIALHPLPVEEFIFFTITNAMLVFGMTLALSRETQPRVLRFLQRILPKEPTDTTTPPQTAA